MRRKAQHTFRWANHEPDDLYCEGCFHRTCNRCDFTHAPTDDPKVGKCKDAGWRERRVDRMRHGMRRLSWFEHTDRKRTSAGTTVYGLSEPEEWE